MLRPASRPPTLPDYRPAWWLPDRHTATLWGRLGRREPSLLTDLPVSLEQWDTPDGDFVEVARLAAPTAGAPRLLLLHGLEGGTHSHYARALFREAQRRGWGADLMLFRSCGSQPNRLPRSYHSGETGDPQFVLERITAEHPGAPVGMVGVSLGGNVLCKLFGELGERLPPAVVGGVAVSVPYDLARASRHIGRGFGAVYERAFLKSLIPKALGKVARHPELLPMARVRYARTLWEFDDLFTAPVHGFRDAADYYAKASSLQRLRGVRRPLLLLNAVDDPFIPPVVLDEVRQAVAGNHAIQVEFPARGGHVGFTAGRWPWRPFYYAEWRAVEFLAGRLAGAPRGAEGPAAP
jgi:predicted alpha/beta-fold hydrolase